MKGVRFDMNLLITGANGFMGKNLSQTLALRNDTLFLADVETTDEALREAAAQADFVFHLAGVNRPLDEADFRKGNTDYTQALLNMLEQGKCPPVLLSGSIQAALDNPYGVSKRLAENALRDYAARTGAKVFLYRLTNVFG